MAKRIILGLLALGFGLFYNAYRTELEEPKTRKKVMLIKHDYDSEVLWIDGKFYDLIEKEDFILNNAPKGSYTLVDINFIISQDSTNIIFRKIK